MYETKEANIEKLEKKAYQLRNMVFENCIKTNTGHIASSFSCIEILTCLYYGNVMKYKTGNPKWIERDRFILSKGHAGPALYTVLADVGFYPKAWLKTMSKKDGKLGIHIQENIPGIEIGSGSLGHGLGIGAGIALAAKMDKRDYNTFVLMGDGECYEGSIWESAMFASAYKLDNLVAIIDRNWLSATAFTEKSLPLNPLDKKWGCFNWEVREVDGHSIEQLLNALYTAKTKQRDAPLVIIANTIKGKGISFMENNPQWHGKLPKNGEIEKARKELNNFQK